VSPAFCRALIFFRRIGFLFGAGFFFDEAFFAASFFFWIGFRFPLILFLRAVFFLVMREVYQTSPAIARRVGSSSPRPKISWPLAHHALFAR
jgi:hypothetical protein